MHLRSNSNFRDPQKFPTNQFSGLKIVELWKLFEYFGLPPWQAMTHIGYVDKWIFRIPVEIFFFFFNFPQCARWMYTMTHNCNFNQHCRRRRHRPFDERKTKINIHYYIFINNVLFPFVTNIYLIVMDKFIYTNALMTDTDTHKHNHA